MGWTADLVPAYLAHTRNLASSVRFALVTRALLGNLPDRPCEVMDAGGGHAVQAIMLARAGHRVTVVDPDPLMIDAARANLAGEDAAVRDRVRLVHGHVDDAAGEFDVVCCHSVLAYVEDPQPMLTRLLALTRPGGILSILALNGDAIAMRSGLSGDWAEALASLRAGRQVGARYLSSRPDTVGDLGGRLAALGAQVRTWHGVRVFTDHIDDDVTGAELADIVELEWQAGLRDPYRGVARLFHLIAERGA
ncbi:methyltransferase [Nonomuraea sp. NPDC046802]|uniref:methyltransferase n=1 Tax=Nonomuraea sp. NPDC046802 TaxID=3154919 RepID=UPI0033D271AC